MSFAGILSRDIFIGMDMIKPEEILVSACNDRQGITAAFNKNILRVLNRRMNATFDLSCFDHVAFYNEKLECKEMHLRANRNIHVEVKDLDLHLIMRRGETIFTEICRKFSRENVEGMAVGAGLRIVQWFTDPRKWFSLVEFAGIRL
jgi:L-histidine N-alpha-methyltransferase